MRESDEETGEEAVVVVDRETGEGGGTHGRYFGITLRRAAIVKSLR